MTWLYKQSWLEKRLVCCSTVSLLLYFCTLLSICDLWVLLSLTFSGVYCLMSCVLCLFGYYMDSDKFFFFFEDFCLSQFMLMWHVNVFEEWINNFGVPFECMIAPVQGLYPKLPGLPLQGFLHCIYHLINR